MSTDRTMIATGFIPSSRNMNLVSATPKKRFLLYSTESIAKLVIDSSILEGKNVQPVKVTINIPLTIR